MTSHLVYITPSGSSLSFGQVAAAHEEINNFQETTWFYSMSWIGVTFKDVMVMVRLHKMDVT